MSALLKCRVCGKMYEGCHTHHAADGIFRWNEVACCPEHGEIYLQRIMESRGQGSVVATASEGQNVSQTTETSTKKTRKKKQAVNAEVEEVKVETGEETAIENDTFELQEAETETSSEEV